MTRKLAATAVAMMALAVVAATSANASTTYALPGTTTGTPGVQPNAVGISACTGYAGITFVQALIFSKVGQLGQVTCSVPTAMTCGARVYDTLLQRYVYDQSNVGATTCGYGSGTSGAYIPGYPFHWDYHWEITLTVPNSAWAGPTSFCPVVAGNLAYCYGGADSAAPTSETQTFS